MNAKVKPCPVVVLVGGSGSNLQALIDSANAGLPFQVAGVISHVPDAYGLTRAHMANIPTTVINHQAYDNAVLFEQALIQAIHSFAPRLIILAGFMRILSATFVDQFPGQILNIHPSLLPKFKGLNTHQRALSAGELEHGVSVHFVTKELDGGPIIAQVKISILPTDDADSLRQRVLTAEHWLYPQIVTWFAENRLKYHENVVTLDERRLDPQGLQLNLPTAQGIAS